MKIGIITWHYYKNFGSALQAFALQSTLSKWGDVEFINYHKPIYGIPNKKKDTVRFLLGMTLGRMPFSFASRFMAGRLMFERNHLHVGKLTIEESDLPSLTKKYDVIFCGSDQIWAPNVFSPVYFAAFAGKEIKKVSYAASIGLNTLPEELVDKYKELLSDFHAISVREDEGCQLLKDKCGIDAKVVLDPTLLHDAAFYKRCQRVVPNVNGDYIFCYFLNEEHKYGKSVRDYASQRKLKVIGVSFNSSDNDYMENLVGMELGADHFIWLIENAKVVLTDSYHGTIFSLLFHKEFRVFQRFEEKSPICQNSRIRQLQSYFGLKGRILRDIDPIIDNDGYDFNTFESRIQPLREASVAFIKEALR